MPPIRGRARQAHGAPTVPPSIVHGRAVSDEAKFLAALPVIDDVAGQVCRRHRLSAIEADDFKSEVRLHFIERNYEVLRKFEGRCALSTYVNVVVQRVFLDYRNRMWGRWRPSTEARRLGPTAVVIERLVTRDGWTLDQALEMLRTNHQVEIDETHRAFCNTLSSRAPGRRMVSEEDAADVASPGPPADANVVMAERGFTAKRIQAALDRARQGLPSVEQLIVKMRFEDGVAISDIARALHLEQRPLYRTIERVMQSLRAAMEAEGISRADIEALLNAPTVEWSEADGSDTGSTTLGHPSDRKGASWRSR
jgi:RNA polymerase sigma factor (sigma-70 family)